MALNPIVASPGASQVKVGERRISAVESSGGRTLVDEAAPLPARHADQLAAVHVGASFKMGVQGTYSTLEVRVDFTDFYPAGDYAQRDQRGDEALAGIEQFVNRHAATIEQWRVAIGMPPSQPADDGPTIRICSICDKPQYETPSGWSCGEHGGAQSRFEKDGVPW